MRRLVFLIAALAAALALSLPVADAQSGSTGAQVIAASGLFVESPVLTPVRTASGVIIFDAGGSEVLTGTFTGSVDVTGRCILRRVGQVTCTVREDFTGTVAGHSGSVVWFAVAQIAFPAGPISGNFAIVSGTGGLAGLHGAGTFTGMDGSGSYSGQFVYAG
jgi:hypothetical protein